MKTIMATTIISLFLTTGYYYNYQTNKSDFDFWAQKNGKYFSAEEKLYREQIYNLNKQMIKDHNEDSSQKFKMRENQFMTLTKEEFLELHLNKVVVSSGIINLNETNFNLKAVDWRSYSTVKTQGSCASGWAFSVTNSLEAWYYIRGGKNISVSTQQIVDCDTNSNGCTGGINSNAMQFVESSGIVSSQQYPYIASDQMCKSQSGTYKINNYTYVGGTSSQLQSALQNYPVSVGVDASNWQFYSQGVFSNCKSDEINHYSLAVGFDLNNNWIIQNSFGQGWGELGHIILSPGNTCGILNQANQIF